MNYTREITKLKGQAGEYVLTLLEQGAYLAGGAITSVFSDSRINDFDLFFRNKIDLESALATVPYDDKTVITDSAISFLSNGHRVQIVKAVVGKPEEVIKKFDFTICQGAFDLTNGFYFGTEFFQHLAQRRLVFNINADFPICSLYRLQKFMRRGFHFSGIEAVKLGLRIQALNISNYAELKRQLMGIDTLFLKDLTDSLESKSEKDYNFNAFMSELDAWLKQLDEMTRNEEVEE